MHVVNSPAVFNCAGSMVSCEGRPAGSLRIGAPYEKKPRRQICVELCTPMVSCEGTACGDTEKKRPLIKSREGKGVFNFACPMVLDILKVLNRYIECAQGGAIANNNTPPGKEM